MVYGILPYYRFEGSHGQPRRCSGGDLTAQMAVVPLDHRNAGARNLG
jgi:hypothetical protein